MGVKAMIKKVAKTVKPKAAKAVSKVTGGITKLTSTSFSPGVTSSVRGGFRGRSRRKGPTYWANKVLVEKLKKRYNRLKYGSMR